MATPEATQSSAKTFILFRAVTEERKVPIARRAKVLYMSRYPHSKLLLDSYSSSACSVIVFGFQTSTSTCRF